MRYLIIGGTSIFGEGIVKRLLDKTNTEIILLTKMGCEPQFTAERTEWHILDVRDTEAVNSLVKYANADIIFDLANQSSVGVSWKEPTETVNVNIVGMINVLNAIRDHSPKSRLVIGGSGEEYGRLTFDALPVREELTPQPNNIYGATKACQTMFAKLYHNAFGLDIIVLRTFYETSISQDDQFAISSFCKQFAEIEVGIRENIIETGNLNNIRDFTDVDDLTKAFVAVAEYGRSGEIYNAANGRKTSLSSIVELLSEITGINPAVHSTAERMRPMDTPAVIADISKIEQDCGWKPEIPLKETVYKIYELWKKRLADSFEI